ncbi:mediator of RNA polymerase II transcription subunit 12 [Prosopis cineraria]|uniref:mediator of RNA polymerase II transcription subunit 12 n=1 Tax=Prosopis cineraria TaxID=364024 RepID=UPI00240EDE50|nr:mediator of RNA polymerase II transcription subunit 12 [Prosopis cineraria]XP_054784534.1 mediator of RNA polymerase II transcription subunit 12 [Prosopis cineraria]XP_054784535.1 mediator of RNA polymerase II transcription subunit 12 [Prosopis cineraria]XP_054784536.1 mediator of RNA polymerase II transcription subunit 12 [Prosopis cineraria]XP_054784537.1 mediator of RNA polymerase II transcription subunit 12 [Prosopis cineraria]
MQRYHAGSCTSAVNNSSIGGPSARDSGRSESSSLPANYSINSRRQPQLTPYKLRCDKESLNSRLGPPDFHPQTPNCPEETLTKEYVQSGYRETVDGLEEAREISLTQVANFNKTIVLNCKEAIRKRLRAINESRVQKRKAGQIYGVALSGSQLTKPGLFPELRACGEDLRKKWIEGLSQHHKRLRSLADHVPHGYKKKSLLEVLIKNNVPLLRATWYIKVTYLNQVQPGSASLSSGAADKTQLTRSEHWTKDVVDYLQSLLDDFFSKNASHFAPNSRDRSPQMPYTGSLPRRIDSLSSFSDSDEPSLHFKWWYVVRLLQWHHAEGLILPSLVIDWVLTQLKEKQMLEILQLVLPIIYGFLETIVLSQAYVRTLAGIALRIIRDPAPGGSDLVDNSRRAYTTSALIEMLRYLILAAPDTFVALDCFPLPSCVVSHTVNDGNFVLKTSEVAGKIKSSSDDVACMFRSKGLDPQYQSLAFSHVISSVQKHAEDLVKAANPGYPGYCLAKAAQVLDRSLMLGDIQGAYKLLFEDLCDRVVSEGWISKVSPCLRLSLKWIGTVNTLLIHSVFFLCEWATCDFRDFRSAPPCDIKFTGRKDLSQVHVAVRILKMKMRDMQNPPRRKNESIHGVSNLAKCSGQQSTLTFMANVSKVKSKSKNGYSSRSSSLMFESPGPLHDIIVCWIDQHVIHKGEGLKRLHLFIVELTRAGIFYPLAYARQLIVSGIMDMNANAVDLERQKRHYRILKQLPGQFLHDALEESGLVEGQQLVEALQIYSNERRLMLHSPLSGHFNDNNGAGLSALKKKFPGSTKDGASTGPIDQWKNVPSKLSSKNVKNDVNIEELKEAISMQLQLPDSFSNLTSTGSDESQGSVKRPIGSPQIRTDLGEGTPGCEECRKAKRQKLSEERNSFVQVHSPVLSDDEDAWWVKKGLKSLESLKVDQPLKPIKQVTKSRQKTVRKTQSLAQLAAARIEGSQGASTSHVCDNRVSCPHHRTANDGDIPKSVDGNRTSRSGDIVSIGKTLKRLRFVEKRSVTVWLMTVVRHLIEETGKTVGKVGHFGRPFAVVDDRNSIRWKLGEDELSAILYLMDISDDLVSAVKFLLWLLPKAVSSPSSTIHSGRNVLMLPRNVESQVCDVGEAFLLSSLRRYENILAAADLIPEALSAAMHRAAAIVASNGRISGSGALPFARYLLKKYSNVTGVIEWEKNFKVTCDKRLASELESGRLVDGELGIPLGVPAGVEDLDDFFRQKISGGRLSRVGLGMRDIVQRNVEEVIHYLFGKERKVFTSSTTKGPSIEKWDNGYQTAQQIVVGLVECIRQTGGAAQEGDPSLVSSAISAIVGSVGPTLVKMPDFSAGNSHSSSTSTATSLNYARCILRMHITCLCLLKEALGERQSRVFEIALATEALTALAGVFAPGKASRGQFQMSPEAHDTNTISNDVQNSNKVVVGKSTKIAAAVSALLVGAIIYGVTSLERMVTILKLKEGLDVVQFARSTRSNSNGNARSVGAFKVDGSIELYVHWFRLLVGNCRTICEGLVVELLGEPSIIALLRMQRMLPLSLVFPPAYSIFAFVMWRPFILNANIAVREDMNQLYQSLTMAMNDAVKHLPFREVLLRDSQGLYDLIAADAIDAEFAKLLEMNGSDIHLKSKAFVPLRARLFLNAIIDCKMLQSMFTQEDGSRVSGHGESKIRFTDSESKLQDKLVNVLDSLQPAKFHWQWVELRLLLNEQALIEKLEAHDISLANAIQLSSPSSEKAASASENENNFIEIILTRLLVRPDAAPLFSELVHLFGRSLEDSMLLQAKWFLGGQDVLFGRKTIRQRLNNIAESKGLSVKTQFWEPWGWCSPGSDPLTNKGDKKKFDAACLEEGEVVEEGMDLKRTLKGLSQGSDSENLSIIQQHVTERALIGLILPCIDQISEESRNSFANDLIKQLYNIEQQITAVTRGPSKPAGSTLSGIEGQTNKVNTRKNIRGSSPGLGRRPTAATASATDSAPPSPAALRASMSLRLQLLMRFLPILCTDREPSVRNMRNSLASVILRLLCNRVVHEDADISVNAMHSSLLKKEVESPSEAALVDFSVDGLFDRLLLVLHALLSDCLPSWLKSKPSSKTINEPSRDFSGSDRELLETLQNELDRTQLPDIIRWRIQAAMPVLLPSLRCSLSCQPPSVPISAIFSLQPGVANSGFNSSSSNVPQKNLIPSSRSVANTSGKLKQDNDLEVDPWTLLEDGAGLSPSASNTSIIGSGDHVNLRAACWLKGAIRMRRTDLTYIGAVDDES